jgi:diadenosine tetraphosphate (Ap4A) HIT family hydrolase
VHFHIIPKPNDATGLGIGWKTQQLDADAARQLAAQIADAAR